MEKSSSTVVGVTPEREAAALDSVNHLSARRWDDPGDAASAQAEISLEILKVLRRMESHLQVIAEQGGLPIQNDSSANVNKQRAR